MKTENPDLERIINDIEPLDTSWVEKAKDRTARLVMPTRALGRLHEISEKLCAIQKTLEPSIYRKSFLVMAGDHGVVAEGVSAYPQEVTAEMIKTFLSGGAGINVLAEQVGAEIIVVDMGIIPELDLSTLPGDHNLIIRKVANGTANLARGPAMSAVEARRSILTGFQLAGDLFEKGAQILGTGDMGIGNTTPSAAIGAVLTRSNLEDMVGRGTGVDDQGLQRKRDAIQSGIQLNQPEPEDGLDVLAKIGGFEIGGIAGCILAGAYHKHPVVIDGFISTAGALIAHALCPAVTDYLFAGHCSEEPGHNLMLNYLGLQPILDLGMRLGEGTGAALAMGIMDGAVRIFKYMLTFEEAGVSNKD
ncbi:MAG: nicotinate-nucleotide--dimethylbenzimidazole phosphoribosyltransferase [Deltaproteobacteria bacterium]|nr:MAG: nicotinate-nucleotide--dimethylbenzimidazole phosphoribosyltransferase [Deltaproteobacteria bacterium]